MRKPPFVVVTPGLIRRNKIQFAALKVILGLVIGVMFSFLGVCLGTVIRVGPTIPEGSITVGEIYELVLEHYQHLLLVMTIAITLTIFFSILTAYINPYIPVSQPPRKYITRMLMSEVAAAFSPTFGYCVFGWIGFSVGCAIPFVVFPWIVRTFTADTLEKQRTGYPAVE